jgi:NMD protein affecting ribosome stability and mRNA decay
MGKGKDTRKYREKLKDPYMDKNSYRDPTICPGCGLIFHQKRWLKDEKIAHRLKDQGVEFNRKDCPACRKIKDNYPLGILEIEAEYVKTKREELKNLITNVTEREEWRNPLERIMKLNFDEKRLYIETTTEHLAKKIGNSVRKAFGGELKITFSDKQKLIRVYLKE